jgi:hypothetical protein
MPANHLDDHIHIIAGSQRGGILMPVNIAHIETAIGVSAARADSNDLKPAYRRCRQGFATVGQLARHLAANNTKTGNAHTKGRCV